MVKNNKERKTTSMHHGRGWYFLKGIIALLLGIALYGEWLGLPQVIAIILILVGIKHILYPMCSKRK